MFLTRKSNFFNSVGYFNCETPFAPPILDEVAPVPINDDPPTAAEGPPEGPLKSNGLSSQIFAGF